MTPSTLPPSPRRLSLVLTLLIALAASLGAAPLSPSDAEARLVDHVNESRASAGLPPLRVSDDLVAVARRHSQRMADQQNLHHNPNLGSEAPGDWRRVGENVGRGPDTPPIHDAFLASPSHRANVLDGGFEEIGVGVVIRDGELWVTQVYRELAERTTAPPPPSDPEPSASEPSAPEPSRPAPTRSPSSATTSSIQPAAPMASDEVGPATASPVAPAAPPELGTDRVSAVLARVADA